MMKFTFYMLKQDLATEGIRSKGEKSVISQFLIVKVDKNSGNHTKKEGNNNQFILWKNENFLSSSYEDIKFPIFTTFLKFALTQ